MSLWKKVLAWFFLILSGLLGFASVMFTSLTKQFSNCSAQCPVWPPWDTATCSAGNLVCSAVGPFFQATYVGLVAVSIIFFALAYIIFSGWDS